MQKPVEIEVFGVESEGSTNFVQRMFIDSFASLTVVRNYYLHDTFTMKVTITDESVRYLVDDAVLMINGEFFYIDQVVADKVSDGTMIVSGESLIGKAGFRIVNKTYSTASQAPETIVYNHLMQQVVKPSTARRKIGYLTTSAPGSLTGETINYQASYANVLAEIEDLTETYDFGFKEVASSYSPLTQTIQIYKGNDVSNYVEFNTDFENLLDEGYESSNYDEMNYAYVFGEGEGSARKNTTVDQGNKSDLYLKELYVDARDLQQTSEEVTYTDMQYIKALKDRGTSKLNEQEAVLTISGDVNLDNPLFEYGVDYDVGDRVRITSKRFGVTKTVVLTSMTEMWDDSHHTLTPTWGKESPTMLDIIKRGAK